VGKGATRRAHQSRFDHRYRRAKIEGGVFFFTLALADRSSDLLVCRIDRARRAYAVAQE
jgi:putative transposase